MPNQTAVDSSVQSSTSTGAGSAGNPPASSSGGPSGSSGAPPSGGAPVVGQRGFRSQVSQMRSGWEAVIPTGSGVPSRGGTLGQASVLAALERFLSNYTALDLAELALRAARLQEQQDLPAAKALLGQLKEALTAFLGANSPQLLRFGLKPRAAFKPLSAEKAVIRLGKLRATRALRRTMGKVQKEALKSGPLTVTVGPAPAGKP